MKNQLWKSAIVVTLLVLAVLVEAVAGQAPKHPSWTTVVAADGVAAEYVDNYVLTLPGKDGHQEIMTLTCVGQPCYLFKKGDTVTLTDEGLKKVGSRFHNQKEIVHKICGAPKGCFMAALTTEKNPWLRARR